MEDATNSTQTAKVIGRPFPKGVSGNPSGRPKGTLKDFVRQRFAAMTDEEKIAWLDSNNISGIDQWKMGEGNPKQDIEADIKGDITISISEDIANKYAIKPNDTNSSSENNS